MQIKFHRHVQSAYIKGTNKVMRVIYMITPLQFNQTRMKVKLNKTFSYRNQTLDWLLLNPTPGRKSTQKGGFFPLMHFKDLTFCHLCVCVRGRESVIKCAFRHIGMLNRERLSQTRFCQKAHPKTTSYIKSQTHPLYIPVCVCVCLRFSYTDFLKQLLSVFCQHYTHMHNNFCY